MTARAPVDATPRSAALVAWFLLRWKVLLAAATGIVTFLVLFVFVSVSDVPVPGGAQPATAGAMLAVIAAAAVGIERGIEMFWSLVGQLASGWWPFNKMLTEVTALELDVKTRLAAAQAAIDSALQKAGPVVSDASTRLAQALGEMKKLQGRVAELEKLAPGNQRVSLIAATVTQGVGLVAQYQPQIDYNLRLIDQSVAGLTDFAASFKENPARRIINIWAGAMIGLVIAYFVRMDVFLAVLGTVATPEGWWPHLGVALTGLIIGLGSNPTHDVIAALQEVKKYRASQNQPSASTGVTVVAGGGAMAAGLEGVAPAGAETPPAPPVRRFR
jgi:hypothetical protein